MQKPAARPDTLAGGAASPEDAEVLEGEGAGRPRLLRVVQSCPTPTHCRGVAVAMDGKDLSLISG